MIPNWYHSEPSDVPYSPIQFLGWEFFCHFLQQDSSTGYCISGNFVMQVIMYNSREQDAVKLVHNGVGGNYVSCTITTVLVRNKGASRLSELYHGLRTPTKVF